MTASAANGFINTNIADCSGTPFTFHAEYSTAKQQNQVPWAALEGGVLMQQEIGHSEVCNSLSNKDPFTFTAGSQSYSDPNVFDTCVRRDPKARAPDRRGPVRRGSGICQNATTQGPNGPAACPTNDSNSGAACEFADGYVLPEGDPARPSINGAPVTESSAANFCLANRFQNGDLDFDGTSYQSFTWPNGSKNHPTAFEYAGPFQANGKLYPQIQFETNVGASEIALRHHQRSRLHRPAAGLEVLPVLVAQSALFGARVAHHLVRVELRERASRGPSRPSARMPSTACLTWPGSPAPAPARSSSTPRAQGSAPVPSDR